MVNDVHPTAVVLLQPLVFLPQPPKPAPSESPAPASRGRQCYRAGLTTPSYSHPWPVYPSTHPHLLLFSGDGSRTSQPSYSPPCGQPLSCLPRLRVVPFIGLAVVHLPVALGAAWSTWSMNDIHQKWTIRGEADSWVHGRSKEVSPYTRKIIIPPPDSGEPPDGPPYFAKKTFPPDC